MPFPATEENKEKMKQFLVERYRASTFNTCQHQPLPMMHGPPMELFVQNNARPHSVYQPAVVVVHWETKVKQDLDRDVALGVAGGCAREYTNDMVSQNGDLQETQW